jgi:hypothetical protein
MVISRLSRVLKRVRSHIPERSWFVRSIYAGDLLEDFFVSAVAALLAIRLYLFVTGYGQLTFGPLHIAHLMWGGLFMLIGLVMLFSFLNHRAQVLAALVGGIGFGAFIDELGKFITKDNDYFFQPAVAVIYVIFVLVFLATRAIGRNRTMSPQQCLANAFDITMQGSVSGLDHEHQQYALELLARCPAGPVRENLETILGNIPITTSRRSRFLDRVHEVLDGLYELAVSRWWFTGIIIGFFALTAVASLFAVLVVVEWSWGLVLWLAASMIVLVALVWSRRITARYLNIAVPVGIVVVSIVVSWAVLVNLKPMPLSIVDIAQFVFPGISGVLIVIGLMTFPGSRLQAYLMFRLAILVSVFFTQVLSFYQFQFLALLGLAGNVLILVALRYMIAHEHEKIKEQEVG